ncbi:MAG TPA: hypothetical protein VGV86_03670 [Acidimicrobiales bacterium]|nr:hypothetical protein [Acidimicrobiales bacterium]
MTRSRVAGMVVWVAGLGGAAWLLHWAGNGVLATPALTETHGWSEWLLASDPVVVAFSLLRMAALGALWYVAIASVVGAVLRMVGAASLVRVTDRVTIGPVRRMLAGTMSLGLAASGVVAVAAPAFRSPVAAATQTSTSSTSVPPTTAFPPATVTMHRLGPVEVPQPPAVALQPEVAKTAPVQWTVKPGECFWSIADSVLTERLGRSPTDAEIVPYWQRLIAGNRSELVQPDNPDLVLPGQVLTVPAP